MSRDATRTPPSVEAADVARGVMLFGVLHIHLLIAALPHLGETPNGVIAYLQVKLLAPHVAVFFALAGLSSRSLGAKPWPVVLQRSLMLLLVAWLSHAVGVAIQHLLWTPWPAPWPLVKQLVKPMVLGVGHSTFVTWFLVVLAVVRLLAWAFERGLTWFGAALLLAVAAVLAGQASGHTDNFYDWKRWPIALAMFLVGMRLPPAWRVPATIGGLALVAGLALTFVNRPGLWAEGVCLTCELRFIAQPMVGDFGFLPAYLVQLALGCLFVLWLSQALVGSAVGRGLAWLGRNAIPLLVLHGWVILSFYGLHYYLLPRQAGPWLFVVLVLLNTALHVVLLRLLGAPLARAVAACSTAAHRLVALARHAVDATPLALRRGARPPIIRR